jgi:acyl-CoA reductase-like NAD-dependent aldehyde dehydrogenase
MAQVAKRVRRTGQRREMLPSMDPRTGRVTEEIPASTPHEVQEAVAGARRACADWAGHPGSERARYLSRIRHRIHERMDHIVDVVSRENGKPPAEALAHDVLPTLLTLAYEERIAPRALKPQAVGRLIGPLFGASSRIEWRPYGVVGCISPWNYPLFLSFMAAVPALLAGNTVVLKPSEATPAVGRVVAELLGVLPPGVATVVQGGGEVGAALVDAPCDKLSFIGSTATGRKIAEAAARHLTPVVMELGGQDATIVCDDADLDVAASGVLWGSFLNAGQTCCAIERAYVMDSVADRFEQILVDKLQRVGGDRNGDIGPLTVGRQRETVERHVRDATERGSKVLAGGTGEAGGGDGVGGLWFRPTVLEGRSGDMDMFREETFGPVLPIIRVNDVDEAIRRANEEGTNLTASVWTSSPATAKRVSARLRAGTISVNDHASTAGAPWGVWGGVGESGYGRLHGVQGLREFAVPVHVSRTLLPRMKKLWWYPYDEATTSALRGVADLLSSKRWEDRRQAFREIGRSAGRAIKSKI